MIKTIRTVKRFLGELARKVTKKFLFPMMTWAPPPDAELMNKMRQMVRNSVCFDGMTDEQLADALLYTQWTERAWWGTEGALLESAIERLRRAGGGPLPLAG